MPAQVRKGLLNILPPAAAPDEDRRPVLPVHNLPENVQSRLPPAQAHRHARQTYDVVKLMDNKTSSKPKIVDFLL
jgi:hypothetical protein